MGRKPREIKIECVLESGGSERDLARWVAATKIVMRIVERAKQQGHLGQEESLQTEPDTGNGQ